MAIRIATELSVAPSGFLPDSLDLQVTRARWGLWRFPSMRPSEFEKKVAWQIALYVHFIRLDGEEVREPLVWHGPGVWPAFPCNVVNGEATLPEGLTIENLRGLHDQNDWWPPETTEENVRAKILEFGAVTEGAHIGFDTEFNGNFEVSNLSNLGQFLDALQIIIGGERSDDGNTVKLNLVASDLDGRCFRLEKVNNKAKNGKPFPVFTAALEGGAASQATAAKPAALPPTATSAAATMPTSATTPTASTAVLSDAANALMLAIAMEGGETGMDKPSMFKFVQSQPGDKPSNIMLMTEGLRAGRGEGWEVRENKVYLVM